MAWTDAMAMSGGAGVLLLLGSGFFWVLLGNLGSSRLEF
jgi:hypothetical protein